MRPVFSDKDEAFRQEVRAFYQQELPEDWFGGLSDESEESGRVTRGIKKKLADKGWLTMAWPREYGGQEAPLTRQVVFAEESAYFRINARDAGTGYLGIAIMQHGTEEQKRRFLGPISRAEINFHQGFSEPNAGSDLTGLTTRASREGDDYVISGQKIWGGHLEQADYSFLLARTDDEAPKHRGISFFIIPSDTPGLHADTFGNMAGGHQQIVYYDDCKVNARESLIGAENQGWYIAATALNHERAFVEHAAMGKRLLEELIELWRSLDRHNIHDPQTSILRHKLAQAAIEIQVCRLLNYRFVWLYGEGKDPSYEASQVKIFGSEMTQRFMHVAGQVLGLYSQVQRGNPKKSLVYLNGRVEQQIRYQPSYTLMGGTSEIQRNLIATRGLGLPR
ncbi:MAG: acyl-CoA dehydrogenase family protein [Dehalococcoidia bacterium]